MSHRHHRVRGRVSLAALAVVAALLGLLPIPGTDLVSPASAAVQQIDIDVLNDEHVVLGDLASRSQRGPVTIAGIGPYTVSGTDSLTGEPYSFVTDYNYAPSGTHPAYGFESDERELQSGLTTSVDASTSYGDRNDVLRLWSNANCLQQNTFDDLTTYCSAFGPEAWSEPFSVSDGDAVSFDWAATGAGDDYEVYAYLVEVDSSFEDDQDPSFLDYPTENHTLLAYGRGDTQGWTTTSGPVPGPGDYRFRFVNGTYDKTGGYLIGAELYVDNAIVVGLDNPISFDELDDRVYDSDVAENNTFSVAATAPADGPVTYSSSTTDVCTVDGDEVTLTGTHFGVCTVVAGHSGDADHVPASGVARSFTVLDEATSPSNNGLPTFAGTAAAGEELTADEGSWADGGSAVTGTEIQWLADTGEGAEPISGATGASCTLVEQEGTTLSVRVTKTNAVGSTSADSTHSIEGFTCKVSRSQPLPEPEPQPEPESQPTGSVDPTPFPESFPQESYGDSPT
ncbi:MAG: hypothetical protein ACLFRV_13835, partial [Acidimicrobiales bacterium]